MFGIVPHVEGYYHRGFPLQEFQGEIEIPLQIDSIDYINDNITTILHHLSCYLFRPGCGLEGIGAGDIHHFVRLTTQLHKTSGKLHGGPGIVRDSYPDTCESGEEGTLPHIGVAHQKYLHLLL